MTWRLARSLEVLRGQINVQWPDRSKSSDGSIGDEAHASRSSDHNPWIEGRVVSAIDITHDPAKGPDSEHLAETLLKSRDPRIKYIISNRKIASGSLGPKPWEWRPYSGSNPHNHHVHISVKSDAALFDSLKSWKLDGIEAPPEPAKPYVAPPPTLRMGSTGDAVKRLQGLLKVTVDGQFGPKTRDAVKAEQLVRGIVADGICGPQTWSALQSEL